MRWPNLWYKWAGKGDDEGVGDDGEVGHHLKDLGPHADISEDGGYLYPTYIYLRTYMLYLG